MPSDDKHNDIYNDERKERVTSLREERKRKKREAKYNLIANRRRSREEYKNSTEYRLYELSKTQLSNKAKWYKLDNAALLYPMTASGEGGFIFRMSALLKNPVEPETLQLALNDVFLRFPTMTGCVKYGLFWPYIDKPYYPVVASLQTRLPCSPLPLDGKHSQMRVTYYGNEVAAEFFHSATDGTGGIIFLNSLLKCYFKRLGHEIKDTENSLDFRDKPRAEELADDFAKVAVRKNPPKMPKPVKAAHITGALFPDDMMVGRRGICSADELKALAKAHGATVTELLGAVELISIGEYINETSDEPLKPIRIMVPVNLRKVFDYSTLRNFSSYIFWEYHGQTDIDEVIKDIKQQSAEQMNKEYFVSMISYNVNSGNNKLLKIVPLAVKRIAIGMVCKRMGEGVVNTSTLSNVGVIKAPEEFKQLVHRYQFQLGRGSSNPISFGVATYNGVCCINISDKLCDAFIERRFFSKLSDLGINIAVDSDILEGLD